MRRLYAPAAMARPLLYRLFLPATAREIAVSLVLLALTSYAATVAAHLVYGRVITWAAARHAEAAREP